MQDAPKNASKPAQLWQNALRAVRGDSTEQLVEQFTAEMTLVAEGLVEDQTRLKDEVVRIEAQQDRAEQRLASELSALEASIAELQRDADQRLDDLQRRLNKLEGKLDAKAARRTRERDFLDRITLIVGILAGAWVLTAIIGLFH